MDGKSNQEEEPLHGFTANIFIPDGGSSRVVA